jgi:hypothetical protein
VGESQRRNRPAARAWSPPELQVPILALELDVGLASSDDSLQKTIPGFFAYDSSSSDESIDVEYLTSLCRHRFKRCTDTYHYSGDVRTDIQQNDPLDMKGWSSLRKPQVVDSLSASFPFSFSKYSRRGIHRASTLRSITPSPSPPPPIGLNSGRIKHSRSSLSWSGCHFRLPFGATALMSTQRGPI